MTDKEAIEQLFAWWRRQGNNNNFTFIDNVVEVGNALQAMSMEIHLQEYHRQRLFENPIAIAIARDYNLQFDGETCPHGTASKMTVDELLQSMAVHKMTWVEDHGGNWVDLEEEQMEADGRREYGSYWEQVKNDELPWGVDVHD